MVHLPLLPLPWPARSYRSQGVQPVGCLKRGKEKGMRDTIQQQTVHQLKILSMMLLYIAQCRESRHNLSISVIHVLRKTVLPFGSFPPRAVNFCGFLRNSTTSCSSFLASSTPLTCSNVTFFIWTGSTAESRPDVVRNRTVQNG